RLGRQKAQRAGVGDVLLLDEGDALRLGLFLLLVLPLCERGARDGDDQQCGKAERQSWPSGKDIGEGKHRGRSCRSLSPPWRADRETCTNDSAQTMTEPAMTEALRRKLINAGRVLAMEDQGDYVAGHVTVRLPDDKSRFLMKP